MVIAVTGGTGTVGRHVVRELSQAGHAVRVLTRHAPATAAPRVEHRRVDLATGDGLHEALSGIQVVIDAANPVRPGRRARAVLAEVTRRVMEAERRAGVAHHVAISIVGIEQVPFSYYEAKLAQEAAVRQAGVPWTIVRATQFHDLLDTVFCATARARLLPAPEVALQPVDPRHVAEVVAAIAQDEPLKAWEQVAGPQVERLGDLARAWKDGTGRRARSLRVPLPHKLGAPLAAGALVPVEAVTGGPTFTAWLKAGTAPSTARPQTMATT